MDSLEKKVVGAFTLVSLSGCLSGPHYDTGMIEEVVIYPYSPGAREVVHCRVDGYEDKNSFDFHWFVNRKSVYAQNDISSSLKPSYFQKGDLLECSAWSPASEDYDGFEIGEDSVYVE